MEKMKGTGLLQSDMNMTTTSRSKKQNGFYYLTPESLLLSFLHGMVSLIQLEMEVDIHIYCGVRTIKYLFLTH